MTEESPDETTPVSGEVLATRDLPERESAMMRATENTLMFRNLDGGTYALVKVSDNTRREATADSHHSSDRPEQPFEEWLSDKVEEYRAVHKQGTRSENPRQTDIALGRLRAFREARREYINRKYTQQDTEE